MRLAGAARVRTHGPHDHRAVVLFDRSNWSRRGTRTERTERSRRSTAASKAAVLHQLHRDASARRLKRRFRGAKAALVGMSLAIVVWNNVLVTVQMHPNRVANWVMRTTDLDYGNFWLLAASPRAIDIAAAASCLAVVGGHLFTLLHEVFPARLDHKWVRTAAAVAPAGGRLAAAAGSGLAPVGWRRRWRWLASFVSQTRADVAIDGKYRRFYVLAWEVVEVAFQTATLFMYQDNGVPVFIVASFVAVNVVNDVVFAASVFVEHSIGNVVRFEALDLWYSANGRSRWSQGL